MVLAQMIHINEMLKLILGQGHKVQGQGQICSFVNKNLAYSLPCIVLFVSKDNTNGTVQSPNIGLHDVIPSLRLAQHLMD